MMPHPIKITPLLFAGIILWLATNGGNAAELSKEEQAAGFVSLFNGKNLDGWQGARETYVVEKGVLVCKAHGSEDHSTHQNLFTAKQYSDFAFRFEFRLQSGANNGVAVRSPLRGNPSKVGMEIQILDDDADRYKNLDPHQYHGSVYMIAPAKRGHLKPVGQWNSQEILFNGRHAKITLNGVVIVDVNLDKSGDEKYLDRNTGKVRTEGYLGFLGHGSRVEFRNIRIKELRDSLLGNKATTNTASGQLKALIVDGRMNRSHDWKTTSALLKKHLEESGLFAVDFATAPPKGESLRNFKPNFDAYDVVVFNYEADEWTEAEQWPTATRKAFVDYVREGGGVVIHHTSSGAFPAWKEYSEIAGLGGWHGRTEKNGPYIYWRDGRIVRDNTAGPGGGHGPRHEFPLIVRNADHPITQGLPGAFMHSSDELYNRQRGPAMNLTVLATAFSPEDQRGTGRHEPMLMTTQFGKGNVFNTTLGHNADALNSVAFIVTFQRGAEWAATGKVTQSVPEDFPTPYKSKTRK